MTTALNNPILGSPLLPPEMGSPVDLRRARNLVPIERQLRSFLGGQIAEFKPDRIVVIERKGTAILRALTTWQEDPLEWPWSGIVSSVVIPDIPNEWFADQRILVFDDMMRSGDHLLRVFDSSNFDRMWKLARDVRVAVFAVHEKSAKGIRFGEHVIPNVWFYNDLPSPAYRNLRLQVVEMLQRAGSLMLDTEHLEVRLTLRGSLERFVQSLRRRAAAMPFHSAGRTNITVYYEDDPAHELPAAFFPPGTELTGIVKKCRIVQREGDTFAVIPMCYPSVPEAASNWPAWKQHAKLLGPHCADSTHGRFYGVALLGALWILKWVLRDLAASDGDLCRLSLPSVPGGQLSEDSYTLEHLCVMYPEIKLDQLSYLLADTEREAAADGTRLKRRKATYHEPSNWSDAELRADAMQLLQMIRYVLDERLLAERTEGTKESPHPFGLTATEIFRLGERLGWEGGRVSCLFDILIDEANLVTHVQRLVDERGVAHWARTFEPDGEIVSDLARRLTRQWGIPPGF